MQDGGVQKDRRDETPDLSGPDQGIHLFTEDRGNIGYAVSGDQGICQAGREQVLPGKLQEIDKDGDAQDGIGGVGLHVRHSHLDGLRRLGLGKLFRGLVLIHDCLF